MVYGPHLREWRPAFWDHIRFLSRKWNLPWNLGGDFNIIFKDKKEEEKAMGGIGSPLMT